MTISAFQFYFNVKAVTDTQVLERQKQMQFVQDTFIPHLITENFEVLKDKIEKARQLHFVDFYIVQSGQNVSLWYNNKNNLAGINVNYTVFNQILQNDQLAFKTVKIQDHKFTVGIFQDKKRIMWTTAWIMKWFIIRDLILVTAILSIVVYLVLKDILNLAKILSSRSRDELGKLKSLSAEGEVLLRASTGLESERIRLETLSETYGQTVGPAIRHELKFGGPAPYTFQATVCRIDLNGYTQIFLENDPKYIHQVLNSYFARAREIIERYNGLIYQFVGDEIVFLFRDNLCNDIPSQKIAIACIRDLFFEASVIEKDLPSDANHYFKLKGSFAHGTMRFTNLDQGHALSGIPLIESVRLLSLIDEKNDQVLNFFETDTSIYADLAFVYDRKVNRLKGFKEDTVINSAKKFSIVSAVINEKKWDQLTLFRRDSDLEVVLESLLSSSQANSEEEIMAILGALRHHRFSTISKLTVEKVKAALETFIQADQMKRLSFKPLSSFVTLMGHILPASAVTPDIYQMLNGLLSHPIPRVQANVIVTLGHYKVPTQKIYKKMFAANNRVAADTIIEVAKQEMTADVEKALNQLLTSLDPVFRASGQFALKSILEYYEEKDPVYLKTNKYLSQLQQRAAAINAA